ncbi:MAG: sulfatase-like hydrolase/transferase [Rhodobacteraceae bacterium]|nr:sulfatase-like hydrolase/transferase [Paracoccaceae bacterium]NKB29793.1 sulfatase-like hydrolase/transferase [Paracoccaceae bacterium]
MTQIPPRNVMFIIIDQMRADLLHGALADHVPLPNLRALMGAAVSFTNHHSVANPCGPSRASLLTGQYAMNHRSVRNGAPLRHDTSNLATEVRKGGHLPLLFGYTDTTLDPRLHQLVDPDLRTYERVMPGFVQTVEMGADESFPWRASLVAKGYDIPEYTEFYVPVAQADQLRRVDDPAFYRAEDSDTAFLTDACLTHLRARGDRPWFAHLTYIRPHPPLVAPAPYNRMIDPDTLPLPDRHGSQSAELATHPFFTPANAAALVDGFPDLGNDDTTVQDLRAIYLGLAAEVDVHIGRIIAFLKDSGQWDDTLLVVTADHGEMLGDHHTWGKMSPYDAAWHTPLIIRDPTQPDAHGTEVTRPSESVDVTPTILDCLGLAAPPSMDGRSLKVFLQGDTPDDWRTHSYSELDFGNPVAPTLWQTTHNLHASGANFAVLRGPRYTLTHFADTLPPLLFDREGDGEMRNLADDPAMASVLLEMTQTLLSHRMQNADHTLSATQITADGPVTTARR